MRYYIFLIFFLSIHISYSQTDSTVVKVRDSVPKWVQKNRMGLDINNATFVNWNAGGVNSVSALLKLQSTLNHTNGPLKWKNTAILNYGVNQQQEQKLRKTSDEFELASTLGFQKDSASNWYFSSRFNFKTQLTNGYNYPNRSNPISGLMAPGYLFVGGGTEYGQNIEKFSTYFSPLTFKSTFVLDSDLSNAGAFGVEPALLDEEGNVLREGQRVRTELGILLTNAFETEVFENIAINSQVSFYTDYLNTFGNIDVDWEVNFNFKVNKYVRASFGSHLRYDNDVKTIVETEIPDESEMRGAKIQWKQILGIGVVVVI